MVPVQVPAVIPIASYESSVFGSGPSGWRLPFPSYESSVFGSGQVGGPPRAVGSEKYAGVCSSRSRSLRVHDGEYDVPGKGTHTPRYEAWEFGWCSYCYRRVQENGVGTSERRGVVPKLNRGKAPYRTIAGSTLVPHRVPALSGSRSYGTGQNASAGRDGRGRSGVVPG